MLSPHIGQIINNLDAELDAEDDENLEAALDELDEIIATYRNRLLAGIFHQQGAIHG